MTRTHHDWRRPSPYVGGVSGIGLNRITPGPVTFDRGVAEQRKPRTLTTTLLSRRGNRASGTAGPTFDSNKTKGVQHGKDHR
jgi:hypothetical protein